jgi:hypothetical protein
MPKFTASVTDENVWPDISAFFSQLGGQAGLLRIGDPSRSECRYNRERRREASQQWFSDGTKFTDGTGWLDGMMPTAGHLTAPAERGDTFVLIGGLLQSTLGALRSGDLIEFRPNGIADGVPRLHEIVRQANTDADGKTGIQFRPALRAGLAAGDMVVLEYPTSVFHLIDDGQGEIEITPPLLANFGFSLVEAIENV